MIPLWRLEMTLIGMILSTLGIHIKIGSNLKLHACSTKKVSYLLGRLTSSLLSGRPHWQCMVGMPYLKITMIFMPPWMDDVYEVWFRDPRLLVQGIISNPDFASEFNYAPYHEYLDKVHQYQGMMSGNWAWRQAVSIS